MKQQSIRNIFLLIITISSGAVFAYGEAKLEAVSYTHLTLPTNREV